MAQQIINIGAVAGDGTGDPLRESQRKTNENFAELYNIKAKFIQVDTYALMIAEPTLTSLLIIKVLNDENKGIDNTIYYLYPDGTRMWMAAVEDI